MRPNILCETKKGNHYLHNAHMNQFMLIHPIMEHLLTLAESGTDLDDWISTLADENIAVGDHSSFSKEEILYYYGKYRFFDQNRLFAEVDKKEKFSGQVTEEQVDSLLSNVYDVVFEVTDACNLKCKYCGFGEYYDNYDQREKKTLDFQMAKNLLHHLATYWKSPRNASHNSNINIGFYGGEPLLNIDLIKKVVDHVQGIDCRSGFTFRMTTNALLLAKHMDFLVEKDFGLLISLDGDKENNGYRVLHDDSNAYDLIFKNIDALKTKYPDYFEKKVNFNVVLHNKNSVAEVYDYFKKNFDKTPTISQLTPIGIRHDKREEFIEMYRNVEDSLSLSENHLELENEIFQRLPNIRTLCSIVNNCSGYCYDTYNHLLNAEHQQQRVPTGTCLPFSKKLFLSVNGKIMPCERIGHQYYFGTVDREKVTLDAKSVANATNAYFDKIRKKCIQCHKAEICFMCVYNLKVDGDEDVKRCPDYLDYNGYARYLGSWLSKLEETPGYYSRVMDEVFTA